VRTTGIRCGGGSCAGRLGCGIVQRCEAVLVAQRRAVTPCWRRAHRLLTWWHRVRQGPLKRSTFRSDMTPLRREVERLLEAGRERGRPKTAGTCRDIVKRREALWTFVQVEGVEPTNNVAEVRSVDQKPSFQLGGLVLR